MLNSVLRSNVRIILQMESQHSNSGSGGPKLLPSATRLLYSSLPFDSGKAILFLPERGTIDSELQTSSSESRRDRKRVEELSGYEAKQFYEAVLLMPQESKETEVTHRTEQPIARRNNRKRNSKYRTNTSRERKNKDAIKHCESYTFGQMFRFAQEGNLECIESALTSGQFDVNMVDNFNWTLLMSASHAGHMNIVQFLLGFGAQWEAIADRSGNNAADLARITGHHDIAVYIENSTDCQYSDHCYSDCKRLKIKDDRVYRTNGTGKSVTPPEQSSTFFCDICKMRVSDVNTGTRDKHNTSTLHQFSCQHQPNVTSYGISESNRGFQMLLRGGWDPEKGLGSGKQGSKFPVKTVLKQDRLGFGLKSSSSKPRVTHFSAHDEAAVRTHSQRRGVHERDKVQTKKDIVRDVEKDKRWEMRMRRYMNTDY